MSATAKPHRLSDAERYRAVTAARERFLAGDDRVRGVRPEVATSWYRCREQYHVDPGLDRAPPASGHGEPSTEHTLEHEVVFANLGGAAASIAPEVESLGGVVTVTDGVGRILTIQGDANTLRRARESNMAPWSCWSEWPTGTTGMGPALEARDRCSSAARSTGATASTSGSAAGSPCATRSPTMRSRSSTSRP